MGMPGGHASSSDACGTAVPLPGALAGCQVGRKRYPCSLQFAPGDAGGAFYRASPRTVHCRSAQDCRFYCCPLRTKWSARGRGGDGGAPGASGAAQSEAGAATCELLSGQEFDGRNPGALKSRRVPAQQRRPSWRQQGPALPGPLPRPTRSGKSLGPFRAVAARNRAATTWSCRACWGAKTSAPWPRSAFSSLDSIAYALRRSARSL